MTCNDELSCSAEPNTPGVGHTKRILTSLHVGSADSFNDMLDVMVSRRHLPYAKAANDPSPSDCPPSRWSSPFEHRCSRGIS
jgi:hypothetical protein